MDKGKGRAFDGEDDDDGEAGFWFEDEDDDGEPVAVEDWDARFKRPGDPTFSVSTFGAAAGALGNAATDALARGEVPRDPAKPLRMKVKIDEEAAKTWVYPTNFEVRDYQYNIVQKALFK